MRGAFVFEGLPNDMKSFYDGLFSNEGDIFREYPVVFPVLRAVIINGLFESASNWRNTRLLMCLRNSEEVVEVTTSAVRMAVKVDWMDKTLGRITIKGST